VIEVDPISEADSVERVELILGLEEAFDVEIPDNEAEKIHTVDQAVELIQRLKAEQNGKNQKNTKQ
jgi:acyl carrier protein